MLFSIGYNVLPSRHLYWNSEIDVNNRLVSESMRRERFVQIMKYLHVVDVSHLDLKDKMWKLRPLILALQRNFAEHFVPVQSLNFDESMIKYFGKHGCKQFIRGKPIRFGYKVWCLNACNNYLVNFEVYRGKNGELNNQLYDKAFGKPAAVLVNMIDDIKCPDLRYHFYFDNLFTSLNLLSHLSSKGYYGTGTMRANRLPKNCQLPSKDIIKKLDRGSYYSSVKMMHYL
jgi:DNA excision repair protein ERCC-6